MVNVVEVLINAKEQLTGVMNKAAAGLRQFRTTALSLSLAIAPVGAALADAVRTGAEFEQTMRNVQSVSMASVEDFARLSAAAREIGETTVYSASQAAEALYFLASAGYDAQQQIASLRPIVDFAAATQSDLAEAGELTVATLNAFGMAAEESSRVTNTFAAAIAYTQLTMDRLAAAMPYISSVSEALNISFEETVATVGTLVDSGIRAESAGRLLATSLMTLLDPSSEAKEAIEELGLTLDDVNPNVHGLADIVDTLNKKHADAAAVTRIFGAEGSRLWLTLLPKGGDAIRALTDRITGTNKAHEMAVTQMNSLSGAFRLFQGAIEGIKLAVFDAIQGHLRGILERVRAILPDLKELAVLFAVQFVEALMGALDVVFKVVHWFTSLSDETKGTIAKVAGLVAAFIALAGPIGLLAGTLLPALLSPIGLITLAILAASVAAYKFRYDIGVAFAWVAESILWTVEQILQGLGWLLKVFGADWLDPAIDALQRARAAVNDWEQGLKDAKAAAEAAEKAWRKLGVGGAPKFETPAMHGEFVGPPSEVAGEEGGAAAEGAWEPTGEFVGPPEPTAWQRYWNDVVSITTQAWQDLKAAAATGIQGTADAIGQGFGVMLAYHGNFWKTFREQMKAVYAQLVAMIVSLIAKLILLYVLMAATHMTKVQAASLVGLQGLLSNASGEGKQLGGLQVGPRGADSIITRISPGELVIPEPVTSFLMRAFGQTRAPALAGAGGGPTEVHFHINALDGQSVDEALQGNLGRKIRLMFTRF